MRSSARVVTTLQEAHSWSMQAAHTLETPSNWLKLSRCNELTGRWLVIMINTLVAA
jgi:hypothetical protein